MSEYRVDRDAGVWTFVINRPQRYNALTWEIRHALLRTIDEAEADRSCGVLILTGAGEKSFCSGGDVQTFSQELENFDELWPVEVMAKVRSVGEIARRLTASPIVVISAVNGDTFGGGTFMALSADLVVAHQRARFGFGFSKRGVIPDWGATFILPRLVGMARAKNLILRGSTLTADMALQMGMVAEVVNTNILAHAQEIGHELARGPRVALSMSKQILARSFETGLDGMLAYETLGQTVARRTFDHFEGVQSFVEKRPPVFKGK